MDSTEAINTRKRKHASPSLDLENKTSFADIPDDIFNDVLSYVDFPAHLKLRLNKKLEQRIHKIPLKLDQLSIRFSDKWYMKVQPRQGVALLDVAEESRRVLDFDSGVTLDAFLDYEEEEFTTWMKDRDAPNGAFMLTVTSSRSHESVQSEDFGVLEKGMRRWAQNVHVGKIVIDVQVYNSEIPPRGALEALFQFSAKRLVFVERPAFKLIYLDFSALLILAQNVEEVTIRLMCVSLEAMDLCIIRNNIASGDCKLRDLSLMVKNDVKKAFVKTCFRVRIDTAVQPAVPPAYFVPNTQTGMVTPSTSTVAMETRTFVAESSKPVELYSNDTNFPEQLVHFDGLLMTKVDGDRISFTKFRAGEKPGLLAGLEKVQMGHPYARQYIPPAAARSNTTYYSNDWET